MSNRGMYLIGMLVLLFLANLAMLMGLTNWPVRTREGFASAFLNGNYRGEGFMDYLSSGFSTAPIGSYDGVNLAAGLPAESQGFRAKFPNVPLAGPPVEIGPDNLFYFKNNECKPECCGATLSCDGGCVCTTPQQRDFLNRRGGNREHEDGF